MNLQPLHATSSSSSRAYTAVLMLGYKLTSLNSTACLVRLVSRPQTPSRYPSSMSLGFVCEVRRRCLFPSEPPAFLSLSFFRHSLLLLLSMLFMLAQQRLPLSSMRFGLFVAFCLHPYHCVTFSNLAVHNSPYILPQLLRTLLLFQVSLMAALMCSYFFLSTETHPAQHSLTTVVAVPYFHISAAARAGAIAT